jgi:hypothetical protein
VRSSDSLPGVSICDRPLEGVLERGLQHGQHCNHGTTPRPPLASTLWKCDNLCTLLVRVPAPLALTAQCPKVFSPCMQHSAAHLTLLCLNQARYPLPFQQLVGRYLQLNLFRLQFCTKNRVRNCLTAFTFCMLCLCSCFPRLPAPPCPRRSDIRCQTSHGHGMGQPRADASGGRFARYTGPSAFPFVSPQPRTRSRALPLPMQELTPLRLYSKFAGLRLKVRGLSVWDRVSG